MSTIEERPEIDHVALERRKVARRWRVVVILAVLVVAMIPVARKVGRQWLASTWLRMVNIQVDWRADRSNWSLGGSTMVKTFQSRSLITGEWSQSDLLYVRWLHRVEALDLSLMIMSLEDQDIKILDDLPDLTLLNLTFPASYRPYRSKHGLSDAILSHVRTLRHLKELSIGGNNITDAGMTILGEMSTLEYLNLENTGITDAGLEPLKQLKRLKTVNLTGTKVTKAGVDAFEAAIPEMTVIADPPRPSPSPSPSRRKGLAR